MMVTRLKASSRKQRCHWRCRKNGCRRKTFGNRFRIPIDFELLNDIGPYHQASLADKLEIKLTFNDKKAVILGSTATLAAAADSDYDYSVTDIRTEFDQITSSRLGEFDEKCLPEASSSFHTRIRAQVHEH